MAGKHFLAKSASARRLSIQPAGPNFHPNHSISYCFLRYVCFCVLCSNSRWPPKMRAKQFLKNLADDCVYPMGQNFCSNHPMYHCFHDKCVLAFYAKIQDGCQKWQRKTHFLKSFTATITKLSLQCNWSFKHLGK